MSFGHFIKTILVTGCITLLHAEVTTHPFEIETGMIIYDIKGGAQLTPETNLTIKGKGKLRFKEWGDVKLEEESGVVLTTGAIKHKQHVQRFEKHTKDTVITADFENEQLLERQKTSYDQNIHDETACLKKMGQEKVAGILCDVWEGTGVKKCIYKNIPLKIESQVMDVVYIKEAAKVFFDINTSDDKCKVPDYPVQEFALFKDDIKTKNAYKVKNFCEILRESNFDLSEQNTTSSETNVTDEERTKFINHIAEDIFERQKVILPELLQSLKETRACLQTVENPFEANQCIEDFSRMKEQLGTKESDYILLWDEKRKNTLLDKIEDEIIELQSRMPCIQRAHNITDLSSCLK